MRIHENEIVEKACVETITAMQLGVEEEDLQYSLQFWEETEDYERCLGIMLGIEYFKTKQFGCRVSQIKLALDD